MASSFTGVFPAQPILPTIGISAMDMPANDRRTSRRQRAQHGESYIQLGEVSLAADTSHLAGLMSAEASAESGSPREPDGHSRVKQKPSCADVVTVGMQHLVSHRLHHTEVD